MNLLDFVDLSLAGVLGALIGLERQWNQGSAGLRTNALVAFGAASFAALHVDQALSLVVSGIGFLGAGVIFREGASVRGLNTAATLWCSAAVGTLAGTGRWTEACYCAAGVAAINVCLRWVKAAISRHVPHPVDVETTYQVEIRCTPEDEAAIRALLLNQAFGSGLALKSLHSEKLDDGVRVSAELSTHQRVDQAVEDVVGRIGAEKGVVSARWTIAGGAPAARALLAG
ncbi:MAG TPA: MgtC/SapB family protein [Stellaceae bacterium]|nr:MgtC/SapB family protein [Stellaceae bacterium]